MARLFGTDGFRGKANVDLTAELALDLAVAAAHVLGEAGVFEGRRPFAVVGRDTRVSGEFLEAAVVAGLASAGVDVVRLGVLPTPGVAAHGARLPVRGLRRTRAGAATATALAATELRRPTLTAGARSVGSRAAGPRRAQRPARGGAAPPDDRARSPRGRPAASTRAGS